MLYEGILNVGIPAFGSRAVGPFWSCEQTNAQKEWRILFTCLDRWTHSKPNKRTRRHYQHRRMRKSRQRYDQLNCNSQTKRNKLIDIIQRPGSYLWLSSQIVRHGQFFCVGYWYHKSTVFHSRCSTYVDIHHVAKRNFRWPEYFIFVF